MRSLVILFCALALGACAVAPPAAVDADRFLADSLFRAPGAPIDAAAVLAPSEAMRRYVAAEVGPLAGTRSRQQALVDALRSKAHLKLEYDGAFTRNAAEAFEARSGNCLSLVIMTAALAKEMGVGVRFQNVVVEDAWSRQGNLYFLVGHVNLTLGTRPPSLGTRLDEGESLTIDFLPPPELRGIHWRTVDEKTILAMYMNNRAAESLAAGKTDDAYWFAREAIRQDPAFLASYNTLGIVYHRHGQVAQAGRVFAYALEREPRNTHVMSNFVPVLASLGRVQESLVLERRLAELEPEPPFGYFNEGVAAMGRGDYRAAKDLFSKEVRRAPYYHEFHFWLALALAKLGDEDGARRHLATALEHSTTRTDHDLYAAKLHRITSSRLH